MLAGETVNLKLIEKEELHILADWLNDHKFMSEYETQETIADLEKSFGKKGSQWFFVEKKNGTKIGWAAKYLVGKQITIGYGIAPNERGKGYATEAATIIVDYLFLTNKIFRIQVDTSTKNKASQRVIEKVGFQKEGIIRKHFFSSGKWRDSFLYSMLREEWKEPRILTRKSK
ncbi:MAG: GNAT family N-acetyltransferase [Candidatus Bathyarchaeota archaeon]|nr:GNAT family N-acetyltransferase [Candidatus Bathyarchaeota archaeon]